MVDSKSRPRLRADYNFGYPGNAARRLRQVIENAKIVRVNWHSPDNGDAKPPSHAISSACPRLNRDSEEIAGIELEVPAENPNMGLA